MLLGKLALVTGAAGGIGRATCKILEEAGAKIVATDTQVSAAQKTVDLLTGSNNIALGMNVSKSTDIDEVFEKIRIKYSYPPNVIVNVAGILKDNFLVKTSEIDFQEVFDVNLKGTFLVTKKACELLIDAGMPGSIVNISSIVSKRGNLGQCSYASSKAAVETFSKCTAMEMARHNIRCNTVLPGFIATSMIENMPDKVKNMFLSMIPQRRFGNPEEVAEVIKFLASDQSSYITGTSIQVSGGFE